MIIFQKSLEHLFISMTALLVALSIALPLGFHLSRVKNQKLSRLVIRAVSLIQTFPGLAMIAVIVVSLVSLRKWIPVPATGFLPGIIALSLYALSPVLTNTYTGLLQCSPSMVDVARGLGMTDRQILFKVKAPFALPTILAGVRIAGVWTIGMCTLTSLVGSGGLGDLILQGLRSMNVTLVLSGTIPAAMLAIFFEVGMSAIERWLTVHEVAQS